MLIKTFENSLFGSVKLVVGGGSECAFKEWYKKTSDVGGGGGFGFDGPVQILFFLRAAVV